MREPVSRRGDGAALARRISAIIAAVVLAAVSAMLIAAPARSTTIDEGLPPPPNFMAVRYGIPYLGKFILSQVGRKLQVGSALMDIEIVINDPEPEWFFGQIDLNLDVNGRPTETLLQLYGFEHKQGRVKARLVIANSPDVEHPYGTQVGSIWFALPKGAVRYPPSMDRELEKLTGQVTLEGKTVKFAFKRTSGDFPVPSPLPRAKQLG